MIYKVEIHGLPVIKNSKVKVSNLLIEVEENSPEEAVNLIKGILEVSSFKVTNESGNVIIIDSEFL
jgi:hypothetical protein